MNDLELGVSPTQMKFLSSKAKYTLFCGGIGSGKTWGGALWAIQMALKYPHTKGLITANSYGQLKKATLTEVFKLLDMMKIKYTYRSQAGELEIGKALIYCMSMEKFDLLRGVTVGWAWTDEVAFCKQVAFDILIGRIRDRKGPCIWKGTTTPNGYNWLYKRFVSDPPKSSEVIFSSTYHNLANLADDYVEDLQHQYDEKLAKQELEGQFINLTAGKVYYNFDRNKNCKKINDNNRLIFVGLDFNVDPLCGVYAYFDQNKVFISGEIYRRDSNTFEAAKEIVGTYPGQPIKVVCDETGNRRKTSANMTDHEILRRCNLDVLKFRNPSPKDRYNNVNRLLEQGRLIIDPDCKWLIEDLEQMVYDNKDDMLSHSTDALGYLCWHLFPMKKPKRKASIHYR